MPESDLGPGDVMQIDLLSNIPQVEDTKMSSQKLMSPQYLFAYHVTDVSAINVANVIIDIMTKHAYPSTTLITYKGTKFTSTNIAKILQMCNDQASTDNQEAGVNACISQDEPQDGMWGISPTMA